MSMPLMPALVMPMMMAAIIMSTHCHEAYIVHIAIRQRKKGNGRPMV
jgi:hypothetical protein